MKIIKISSEKIPSAILYEGDEDPEITGYVSPGDNLFRVPIKDGEKIVGFFTPKKDGEEWRVGAIFVSPEYRGKGLAPKSLEQFFVGDKLPAYARIGIDNVVSQNAFAKAGFIPEKTIRVDENGWKSRKWTKI